MKLDRIKFIGLRVAAGLSQLTLAKKVQVSRPTIAGWEDGTLSPKLEQINHAAAALGVQPEELITTEGGEGDERRVGTLRMSGVRG